MTRPWTKLGINNPVLIGSGAFGYEETFRIPDPLKYVGGLVTKGVTIQPRLQESGLPPRIRALPEGYINRTGLYNPGLDRFMELYPSLRNRQKPVIINLAGHFISDYVVFIETFTQIYQPHAWEINVSCPNVQISDQFQNATLLPQLLDAVRQVWQGRLWLKMGYSPYLLQEIASVLPYEIEAIVLLNSLPGLDIINRDKHKFYIGSLSGPVMKSTALRCVYDIKSEFPQLNVIGMGGIQTKDDVLDFLSVGANAIQVASTCLENPEAGENLAREFAE